MLTGMSRNSIWPNDPCNRACTVDIAKRKGHILVLAVRDIRHRALAVGTETMVHRWPLLKRGRPLARFFLEVKYDDKTFLPFLNSSAC